MDSQPQPGAAFPARPARPRAAAAGPSAGIGKISVELSAGPSAAGSARSVLGAFEQSIDPEVMDDVRLLVTELVTNSVRHSEAPGRDTVGLDVSVDERRIRVEVRDRGAGFEPRPRRPGQSKAGGWGLYLVERLTDRWGVLCNHITRVWFEIDRQRATPHG
jgi:anti-sigma regulatory factor (Ser/Thr protein kinase)